MIVLASASCVQKRIEESFASTVADLDSKTTSNNISSWYKLFGTSFGTSGGKVSTSTSTNTLYALRNGYKSFRATASFDGSTGGDAIYFRVKDSNNWMRIREYVVYGIYGTTCNIGTAGGYTYTSTYAGQPNCYGLSTSTPYYSDTATLCGTTVTVASGHSWELCDASRGTYRLVSYYNYGYQEITYGYQYVNFAIAIEKMENGVLTTVGTPKIKERSQVTSSNNTSIIPTTSLPTNPSRTITLTVSPTSISYTGDGVSDSVTNSDLSEWSGVGVGRGSSTVYTSSGINNFTLDIL